MGRGDQSVGSNNMGLARPRLGVGVGTDGGQGEWGIKWR